LGAKHRGFTHRNAGAHPRVYVGLSVVQPPNGLKGLEIIVIGTVSERP